MKNKTFPSPCDTVSQSVPCFSLPNTKSNSDTEYGSEFQISCLVAIFLMLHKCSFFTRVFITILGHSVWNQFELLQTPETRTHIYTHAENTVLKAYRWDRVTWCLLTSQKWRSLQHLTCPTHWISESHQMLHLPQHWAEESIRSEDVRSLRFGALTLDNSTGHLVKLKWEFVTPEKKVGILSLSFPSWLC